MSAPGGIRVFAQYRDDFALRAQVVVVGSGPGGAVVAKELAEAGRDVVLIEEGPPFTPADFEIDGAISIFETRRTISDSDAPANETSTTSPRPR